MSAVPAEALTPKAGLSAAPVSLRPEEWRVPFNRPTLLGRELEYVSAVIRRGMLAGNGDFTRRCAELLQQELGVAKALLTTSGTHALEFAALLLRIGDGDDVIVPSFTFVSTVNAFVLRGARPIFADIRRDTLNLNEKLIEGLVSPSCRAVVPVHYAGVGCEMDAVMSAAVRRGMHVIEDNAHGLFGRYKGRALGSFGVLAAQSFHETKNVTCGEGGALLINDPELIARAEIMWEKGTDRSRFFRGEVDKYSWVDLGSSFLPSELQAAFLWAQLEARDRVQQRRREIWEYYHRHFEQWARASGVGLPFVPEHCEQAYHMFYLLLPDEVSRAALISRLKSKGILAVFHYTPLHLSKMGREFGGRPGQCPVAEDVSERLLRLPFYFDLTDRDLECVVEAVTEFAP